MDTTPNHKFHGSQKQNEQGEKPNLIEAIVDVIVEASRLAYGTFHTDFCVKHILYPPNTYRVT
jgi:hypothetical protein